MESPDGRWLLLIHQIPPKPNYLRVKIGRRLQRLGAVAIKNSVYVLPQGDQAFEDLQWVRTEIEAGGGDATVCEARFVQGLSDAEVEALFNGAREADYAALLGQARAAWGKVKHRGKLAEDERSALEANLARIKRRLADLEAIDFFGAPGRQAVEQAIGRIEERLRSKEAAAPREETSIPIEQLHGRTWVTRKGIHIDRMASAWLVRRFIDADARFKFVPPKGYVPASGEIRFDMFDAEFTHQGGRCTFEVLLDQAKLGDPALRAIAEIVHDVDLKDSAFGREETSGIEHLIAGTCAAHRDDEVRLERGASVFDDLYQYFKSKRKG